MGDNDIYEIRIILDRQKKDFTGNLENLILSWLKNEQACGYIKGEYWTTIAKVK